MCQPLAAASQKSKSDNFYLSSSCIRSCRRSPFAPDEPDEKASVRFRKRHYEVPDLGGRPALARALKIGVSGLVMLVVMVVFGIISLVQKITGVALGGFTTVILLLLFIGSILMISLGIIGYYIARIYDEIKGRPRYIIAADTAKNTTGGQHSHD